MALFRRNKADQTGMPPEIKSYYQAESRERAWTAWLLALVTLFVTVLIVLGIFFGGRWGFRKLKNTDKPAPVAVQNDKDKEKEKPEDSTTSSTPEPTPQTSSTSTSQSGSAPTPAPSGSSATASSTASNQAGKSSLPSTGPEDTLAIFLAVSVLGYMLHRKFVAVR